MVATLQMHTITAFYESRAYADRAASQLVQSGVAPSDVSVSPESAQDEYSQYRDGGTTTDATRKTGFWASLEELFGGTDDQHAYAEGVRRGHVMLTAHVTDDQLDRCVGIIEEHGSIDLNEHEEAWRSEGWTGGGTTGASSAATMAAAGGAAGMALASAPTSTRVVETDVAAARAPVVPSAPVVAASVSPSAVADRGAEDVLQVVEERLNVGKRAVSRGKVRLHSYVVETAVSEDVTLRDETISVDRRAVDRPVAALGADAFQERTIEMEEIDEEAVVGKTARVVEEIGIRKDVSNRTETVRDTIRSTRVEVEDGRSLGAATTGTGAAFAPRLVKDMEVVGSDDVHVGIIDHVDGATMKLKRMDPASGGQHHLLPVDLVASVDSKARLGIAATEAMRRWQAA